MRIQVTDLSCALTGNHPILRIVSDQGIRGFGQVEYNKPFLKPFVLYLREALIGEDPTDVERIMLKIRNRGAFKPYGSAVSVIENALWDLAAKAQGRPVYQMLGGKVRGCVRVYNGGRPQPMAGGHSR